MDDLSSEKYALSTTTLLSAIYSFCCYYFSIAASQLGPLEETHTAYQLLGHDAVVTEGLYQCQKADFTASLGGQGGEEEKETNLLVS